MTYVAPRALLELAPSPACQRGVKEDQSLPEKLFYTEGFSDTATEGDGNPGAF